MLLEIRIFVELRKNMPHTEVLHFFENYLGERAVEFRVLQQSGSERVNYFGKSSQESYIITHNENIRENEAFFYLSHQFSELQLNTPKVYTINENRKLYIQEFVGQNTLSEIIAEEGHSPRVKSLVFQTLEKLFVLQQKTQGKIDFGKSFEYESYDELPIMHDLYYFKNFFADVLEIHYHKSSLLKEFKKMTASIEKLQPQLLMIRDFQARNIMVNENEEVFFIDYQAAMKGPAMYDVISFLYQVKANFSEAWKSEALDFYIHLWDEKYQNELRKSVEYCQLIRFLQVLGAYGFRGLIQKKPHFISSIGQGIKNLTQWAKQGKMIENYPELKSLIEKLDSDSTRHSINYITAQY